MKMSNPSELCDFMEEDSIRDKLPGYWSDKMVDASDPYDKAVFAWGAFMYAYSRMNFDFMEFFWGTSRKPCKFCGKVKTDSK